MINGKNSNSSSDSVLPPPSRIIVRLVVGNSSERLTQPNAQGHTHRWTVYVRAPGSVSFTDRSFIKRVSFMLHDSFENPIRIVKEPPFELTETGYGGFMLPITIQFAAVDKTITINHDLTLFLEKCGDHCIEHKAEIRDPTPEFCALVQRYCSKASDKLKFSSTVKVQKPQDSSRKKHKEHLKSTATNKSESGEREKDYFVSSQKAAMSLPVKDKDRDRISLKISNKNGATMVLNGSAANVFAPLKKPSKDLKDSKESTSANSTKQSSSSSRSIGDGGKEPKDVQSFSTAERVCDEQQQPSLDQNNDAAITPKKEKKSKKRTSDEKKDRLTAEIIERDRIAAALFADEILPSSSVFQVQQQHHQPKEKEQPSQQKHSAKDDSSIREHKHQRDSQSSKEKDQISHTKQFAKGELLTRDHKEPKQHWDSQQLKDRDQPQKHLAKEHKRDRQQSKERSQNSQLKHLTTKEHKHQRDPQQSKEKDQVSQIKHSMKEDYLIKEHKHQRNSQLEIKNEPLPASSGYTETKTVIKTSSAKDQNQKHIVKGDYSTKEYKQQPESQQLADVKMEPFSSSDTSKSGHAESKISSKTSEKKKKKRRHEDENELEKIGGESITTTTTTTADIEEKVIKNENLSQPEDTLSSREEGELKSFTLSEENDGIIRSPTSIEAADYLRRRTLAVRLRAIDSARVMFDISDALVDGEDAVALCFRDGNGVLCDPYADSDVDENETALIGMSMDINVRALNEASLTRLETILDSASAAASPSISSSVFVDDDASL